MHLQCSRTNPSNGSWELGEALPCSILPAPLHGSPIVHLAWAPTAQPELAVIDAFGRVCFVNSGVHANKAAFISRKWDADAQDDLHSIVGCFWLPIHVGPNKMASIRCLLTLVKSQIYLTICSLMSYTVRQLEITRNCGWRTAFSRHMAQSIRMQRKAR